MKRLATLSLVLMVLCASAFAALADFPINVKRWENLSQSLKVINICDLTGNDLNEIMLGHHPEIAIEFLAQTTLPIHLFLKGDLVNLTEREGDFGGIEIKKTVYARCVQQELMLSTDLSDWKPVLEFITGNVSISLNIGNDGNPSFVVGAEINQ
jgi:hypothetical protein